MVRRSANRYHEDQIEEPNDLPRCFVFFFLMIRRPPRSTLFPYTTLFRSRNLLTFARKGPGEQAAVDLNDVIQRTLLLMSYDLKLKDVTIEKSLAPLPPVLGDRHALQQVVINLLNNAAQAVAENPPERPRVILLTTWVDDRVRMRVTDSGAGIAEAVLPHIFTPFFTTKEPGEGTGLGLSITYSIVDAHGGRITVERPAGGGAAFLVDLPAAPADVALRATPVPAPAPAAPAAKRRSGRSPRSPTT